MGVVRRGIPKRGVIATPTVSGGRGPESKKKKNM